MTLKEKVELMYSQTKDIMDANPTITNVWFELNDIPMEELREAEGGTKMYYSGSHKRMVIQNPFGRCDVVTTIFLRSKEVKTKEHIVIDDVMINV